MMIIGSNTIMVRTMMVLDPNTKQIGVFEHIHILVILSKHHGSLNAIGAGCVRK